MDGEKVTSLRLTQSLNASVLIVVSFLGNFILVNEEQPSKACSSIHTISSGS